VTSPQASDERTVLGMVTIAVDKTAPPLAERLELDVTMDDDLILSVTARSAQRKDSASESYFDLGFGIGLPGSADPKVPDAADPEAAASTGGLTIRANVADRPRVAQARPHAEDHPHDRESKANKGGLRSLTGRGRRGGSRHLYPTLAQQVLLLLDVLLRLGSGRRFGTQAPHHQPGPSSACPRGQGPPPAPGSPVPGPDGGLGNTGEDSGHPFQRPRGPGPVQNGHQGHPPKQPVPAVITSHPVIVAQAARVRQAPGLPPPGRCRPARGQGADAQARPMHRALPL
jgi:hypothetical protein